MKVEQKEKSEGSLNELLVRLSRRVAKSHDPYFRRRINRVCPKSNKPCRQLTVSAPMRPIETKEISENKLVNLLNPRKRFSSGKPSMLGNRAGIGIGDNIRHHPAIQP
jgi:hypothetical protein